MAKKPKQRKAERLTDTPVGLRLPADLLARIDAVAESVRADADTAALLGGVTRSAVLRLVILEGVRVLEKRYRSAS